MLIEIVGIMYQLDNNNNKIQTLLFVQFFVPNLQNSVLGYLQHFASNRTGLLQRILSRAMNVQIERTEAGHNAGQETN